MSQLKMPSNYSKFNTKIAIIGGSGLEDPKFFRKMDDLKIKTPFGYSSAAIDIGIFSGVKVGFLPRHGKTHGIPPHKINSRANLWALKKIGIERIIAVSAVGSLQNNFKPGDVVICDQFIDFTKKRDYTFYDKEAVHVSLADPFCPELTKLFHKEALSLKIPVHGKGTYWCIEGPRFSTRAESKFFRNFADVIGMTMVPEVNLARELEICFTTLAMVTDYDIWQKHPVSNEEVIKTMSKNSAKIKKLLTAAIPKIEDRRNCLCGEALKNAKF